MLVKLGEILDEILRAIGISVLERQLCKDVVKVDLLLTEWRKLSKR
jgi:hypothetical protein